MEAKMESEKSVFMLNAKKTKVMPTSMVRELNLVNLVRIKPMLTKSHALSCTSVGEEFVRNIVLGRFFPSRSWVN